MIKNQFYDRNNYTIFIFLLKQLKITHFLYDFFYRNQKKITFFKELQFNN